MFQRVWILSIEDTLFTYVFKECVVSTLVRINISLLDAC